MTSSWVTYSSAIIATPLAYETPKENTLNCLYLHSPLRLTHSIDYITMLKKCMKLRTCKLLRLSICIGTSDRRNSQ